MQARRNSIDAYILKVSTATPRPLCEAGHLVPAIDFVASLIFSTSSWYWTRILVPTHNRPYPGTTVALPDGGSIFVRDPQHMDPFLPDDESAVNATYLRNMVIGFVILIGLLAHFTRREAKVAMPMMMWAIGLTEMVTNPTKNYVGRLRPQFYSCCGWDEATQACTWDPSRMPDPHFSPPDSRHSFPSEHSSLAMCGGLLLSFYAFRVLPSPRPAAGLCRTVDVAQHALHVFLCRLLTPLALTPMAFAVWVGASRVHDNWHHPSDVATGLVLGGGCAAIACHCYFGAPGTRPGYRAVESATEGEADSYRAMS